MGSHIRDAKRIAYEKEYWAKNKERIMAERRAKQIEKGETWLNEVREYRNKNIEKFRAASKASYRKNIEKRKLGNKSWVERNREKKNKSNLAYQKRHPERLCERAAKRRAQRRAQTPDNANPKIIAVFYETAKRLTQNTGIEFQVDHIIPISRGGLHHQANLRIITGRLNRKKNRRLEHEISSLPEFSSTLLLEKVA